MSLDTVWFKMQKGIIYSALGIFILIAGLFLFNRFVEPTKFDSEEWKKWSTGPQYDMSLRWDMMNNLRDNYDLNQKPRKDLVELLGEPDSINSGNYVYILGMAKHGVEEGYLIIEFDNANNVSKFYVYFS